MSGEDWGDDTEAERIRSLVRFGFDRAEMEAFLSEHDGALSERLTWLEERRETASALEDRIVAISQYSVHGFAPLERYRSRLNDPFTIEATFLEFEQELRSLAPWEPPLNRDKGAWFEKGEGEVWTRLYERLARLDVSSHAAIAPLHRLFASPVHADELMRHLELVESDEQRQRQMIQSSVGHLQGLGYALAGLVELPLLESLHQLEQWQRFHALKEQVRLNAVQMIQPFDEALSAEFELRCSQLLDKENEQALNELTTEVTEIAQALEQRRQVFSDRIREWRRQGIVFPHQGDLHPSDLMEWEANHDAIATSVQRHLELMEQWERFARYWPSRVEGSKGLIGHLEKTEALKDVVDELDALWKQLELDGLEFLQTYEQAGLAVGSWQQRVVDDPLNALERMAAEQHRWDRRVKIIESLDSLDTSFAGGEDVEMRRHLLASEELEDDVLQEMEAYVEKVNRRNERHRVMLEEELAKMRRAGSLERETVTGRMNIRDLEQHVAELTRTGGAALPTSTSATAVKRIQEPLLRELTVLRRAGWSVDAWMDLVKNDPVQVARELSQARPHLEHHDVLRRRLASLPWERNVGLGLEVEMQVKQPHRLDHLSNRIPFFTAHLANRPIEDETYRLHLWQPERTHPTLVPVPEQEERPVLRPVSALDEAHEAMLESMELEARVDDDEQIRENEERPGTVEIQEDEKVREDGLTDHEFLEDEKGSSERWEREREKRALAKQEVPPSALASTVPTTSVKEAVEVAMPKEEAKDGAQEKVVVQDAFVGPVTTTEPVDEEAVSALEPHATVEATPSGDATKQALNALKELVALMGLDELADEVVQNGMDALPEVRRGLAQHVNVAPRDIRVGRLLRLTLRLLPEGNQSDVERARMLMELTHLIAPLKRWMRRRLEARHSGAKGDFLVDAMELGTALERIPGLGRHLPLEKDDWPLPSELIGLSDELSKLAQSVNLPSAGGVKA